MVRSWYEMTSPMVRNGNFMVRNDWYEMYIIQSDWLIISWPRLTISFERHNGKIRLADYLVGKS